MVDTHKQLSLIVTLDRTLFILGEAIPITVELINQSQSAIVVNSRFCMGYPDSSDCDLYCEIELENGEPYTGYQNFMVDYRPIELSDRFFTTLAPSESVSATYDLHQWYHITQSGIYHFRVVYAPEPYADKPEAITTTIKSDPATLTVQPPTE